MLAVSAGGRRYGARNFSPQPQEPRARYHRSAPLPPYVDLREHDGPIRDQGDEGSCTAQSGASLRDFIARRYFKKEITFSAAFLYSLELLKDGNFPNDEGSSPLTTCMVLNEHGICPESVWPYVAGVIEKPSDFQMGAATPYRLGGYHLLNGVADYLSALGNAVPWPPVVAFDVYESFESSAVARTGIMPIPGPREELLGGHQVKASGYDLSRGMALLQNSWGKDWGEGGYFWMPFEVLAQSTMRIIHPGHW